MLMHNRTLKTNIARGHIQTQKCLDMCFQYPERTTNKDYYLRTNSLHVLKHTQSWEKPHAAYLLFSALTLQPVQLLYPYQAPGLLQQPRPLPRALVPQTWHNLPKPSRVLSDQGASHRVVVCDHTPSPIFQIQCSPTLCATTCQYF
jgi:hypothetical protein